MTAHARIPEQIVMTAPATDAPDMEELPVLHLEFSARALTIRAALLQIAAWAGPRIGPENCTAVEIVLAEVLNNVAEHAYAGTAPGAIVVHLEIDTAALVADITDFGRPMPARARPDRSNRTAGPAPHDLPEGGFGWHLIRQLTQDLRYHRTTRKNRLCFRLALAPARHPQS